MKMAPITEAETGLFFGGLHGRFLSSELRDEGPPLGYEIGEQSFAIGGEVPDKIHP
jgi:hypothetical protein